MKRWTMLLLAGFVMSGCATTSGLVAASRGPHAYGYTLSGSNVVFSFRAADYPTVSSGSSNDVFPLGDVRINRVSVAGEFNRWSTEAMPMARAGDYWVAARPITEFESSRPFQFKFVINGRCWAEPPPNALNRALAKDGVANLMLQIDKPSPPKEVAPHAQAPVHR